MFGKTIGPKTNLPDFYYGYIAGIICEEPPMHADDLFEYLSPYLLDGKAMTVEEGKDLAKEIHEVLVKQDLITNENKNVYSAERLKAPLILNNVMLMKDK